MKMWLALLLGAPLAAQLVPDVHVVRLKEDAGKARAARTGVREAVAALGGEVITSIDTIDNALVVRLAEAELGNLASLPGVERVYPVHRVRLLLDHAVPLHRIPEAWRRAGGESSAGAGVKIGIIDTGIEADHPAFQDPSLSIPEGYPKVGQESDRAFTNSKIIVARNYEDLIRPTADATAADRNGHGTGTATAAAGVLHTGALGPLSGAAPKAWLGNYKVFAGVGEAESGPPSFVVVKALDDAVADGMNIVNLSMGSPMAPRLEDDIMADAVERAARRGVVVTAAAGNDGPGPGSISSPATSLSVIAVGSTWNDRSFAGGVEVEGHAPYPALPSDAPAPAAGIRAVLIDVGTLDRTGLSCNPLPAGSLRDAAALILRGECTFEVKLTNALQAGAAAAVVYTDEARPDAVRMAAGSARLPSVGLSWADGSDLKARLRDKPGLTAQIRFQGVPFPMDPDVIAPFSGRGPGVDLAIKPDLDAAGVEIYTATERGEVLGEFYNPSGYTLADGTSLSSPIVAGAAAVLRKARPGLTAAQYRSLLVNYAAAVGEAAVQQTGAGKLNLEASVAGAVAVSPVSVSFGLSGATSEMVREVTLSNLGTAGDTFTVVASPLAGAPAPVVSPSSVELAADGTARIELRWTAGGLSPGEYGGVLLVRGSGSEVAARVPYWYGVPSGIPKLLRVSSATPASSNRGSSVTVYFRVTDHAGVAPPSLTPTVTAVSGGGSVSSVDSVDRLYPGYFQARVRLGSLAGLNVFRVQAGDLSQDVTIQGKQ